MKGLSWRALRLVWRQRRAPGPELAALALASAVLLVGAAFALQAAAAAVPQPISLKTVAEVEKRVEVNGHEATQLQPAELVVPGDEVLYTVEIHNTGDQPLSHVVVPYAIPAHMRYVADSAVGPGAEVSFSVDGGLSFDRPERLKVASTSGEMRPATAADYTHIRWALKYPLAPNAVAFARFRAVLK